MKQVSYRLAEALETLCQKKSLENITVSEIAAEAKVTRQVFYRYFEDKYVLASWIHYKDLYCSLKKEMEEHNYYSWKNTMRAWLEILAEKHVFYSNAFYSASEKEFQRMIREFVCERYKVMMEIIHKKPVTEQQIFITQVYCNGAVEKVFEWVSKGMPIPVETLLDYLELAMPETIRVLLAPSKEIKYSELLHGMENYLQKIGLLPLLS